MTSVWVAGSAIYSRSKVVMALRPNRGESLPHHRSHIVNGHVPVQEKNGESPIKGGGRLVVIDGGFCRAYHEKTGIAGYTLVYSSRTMSLRTHQPFESAEKAVRENLDILSQKNILETENHRILVEDTDEGEVLRERVHDLKQLVTAYQLGWIPEARCEDHVW